MGASTKDAILSKRESILDGKRRERSGVVGLAAKESGSKAG